MKVCTHLKSQFLGSEGGGSEIQGHFQLNIKFGASLGYVRSCLKIKQNRLTTWQVNGLAGKGTCCHAYDLNLILRALRANSCKSSGLYESVVACVPPPIKKVLSVAFEVGWTSNTPQSNLQAQMFMKAIIYIRIDYLLLFD